MIIFFYGEDNYRLRKKVQALKARFISASLGDTNLATLDGKTVIFDEFIRQIFAMPFLAKSRLVIVENILKEGKKDILEKIPEALVKVPKSTILVFVEERLPDRRLALFKKLNAPGRSQEFKLLELEPLRRWIKKAVEDRGGTIDTAAISKLIEYVGNDLWRQSNEIDKLTTYSSTSLDTARDKSLGTGNKQLTTENIELLINPQVQANIFNLIDQIARRNLTQATKELYKLLTAGENELYILTMIVYQYRNLLVIKDLLERIKSNNRWTLAKKAGLHPFVVQKSLMVLPRYSLEELERIYHQLRDFDIKIKTGKIESRVALELLIYRLTAQKSQITNHK